MEKLIELKNLTVKYANSVVIDKASFSVMEGDFICVVGANGSGKSTLIKTLLGLISPAEGKVEFLGGLKRTQVGYLPQESKIEQGFPATVTEVVLSGTLGRLGRIPIYRKTEKERVKEALKLLKITKLEDKSFSGLSGGERQKVLLARALVATEKLLILDEPSNNLDQRSRAGFYKILKQLNKEAKLTILMITHDLDAEDLIGNKILSIKNAKVELATTEEFLRRFR